MMRDAADAEVEAYLIRLRAQAATTKAALVASLRTLDALIAEVDHYNARAEKILAAETLEGHHP